MTQRMTDERLAALLDDFRPGTFSCDCPECEQWRELAAEIDRLREIERRLDSVTFARGVGAMLLPSNPREAADVAIAAYRKAVKGGEK